MSGSASFTGTELFVRRAVWRTAVDQTKTQESKSVVPVISPLQKMLNAHRTRNGDSTWIFAGEKKGFALNLDNLARRSIIPKVGGRWHGWHGWRRGLATILFDFRRFSDMQTVLSRDGITSCWNRASRGVKP
jgi:hypothetical protein